MKLSLVGLRDSCGHEVAQSSTKVPGLSVWPWASGDVGMSMLGQLLSAKVPQCSWLPDNSEQLSAIGGGGAG